MSVRCFNNIKIPGSKTIVHTLVLLRPRKVLGTHVSDKLLLRSSAMKNKEHCKQKQIPLQLSPGRKIKKNPHLEILFNLKWQQKVVICCEFKNF